jgi:predicted nucleic acid-binding protein
VGELLEALQRRGRARATSLTPLSAAVLACAAAARADAIVSGDAYLKTLTRYRGIDIVLPVQAIAHISP